jgi:hypothetical protein
VSIEIGIADVAADRDLLADLLGRFLTRVSSPRRCQWFYEQNPHGRATVHVARELDTGRIVGSGAVIPRQLWLDGQPQKAAVLADFWIHPDHRTLGPALQLQRACLATAEATGAAVYDLPQGTMPAVYRRLRLLGDDQLRRYAMPLHLGRIVQRIVPVAPIAAVLAGIGSLALRVPWAVRASRCRVVPFDGRFDATFAPLLARAPAHDEVAVVRSPEYLNWRYRDHYHLEHRVFVALRDDVPVGYAVALLDGTSAELLDVQPMDDARVTVALVNEAARQLRALGAETLSMAAVIDGAAEGVLRAAGLVPREGRAVVLRRFAVGGATASPGRWRLGYGDIDY